MGTLLGKNTQWCCFKVWLLSDAPEASDKVGFFPVESENDHESIAGFDDKHLNFRISVISQDRRALLLTWVHPHNIGGKFTSELLSPFTF
jgi:hypothetical protein